MRLNESVEEDVINKFKEILDCYSQLSSLCNSLSVVCDGDKDLKFEVEYLADFVNHDLGEKIHNTEEEILDIYYPIDYADDEENRQKASEIYRDSKEAREAVFK